MGFASESETLRRVEEGEMIEVTDGPKSETKDGTKRILGRTLADGRQAWFTLCSKSFQQWAPKYKCAQSTDLDEALEVKEGATSVRKMEKGETLDALETPTRDSTSGLLRVRVRATKDGAVGFATLRNLQAL